MRPKRCAQLCAHGAEPVPSLGAVLHGVVYAFYQILPAACRYESIIATLCENLDTLDEPEAKASMIWIIGEYAERIDNADELLEQFLETFPEETTLVSQRMSSFGGLEGLLAVRKLASAMLLAVCHMVLRCNHAPAWSNPAGQAFALHSGHALLILSKVFGLPATVLAIALHPASRPSCHCHGCTMRSLSSKRTPAKHVS